MYKATIKTQGHGVIRIFPRGRKTSFFKTVSAVTKAMEQKTRSWKHDSFGRVHDRENNLVYTIAL